MTFRGPRPCLSGFSVFYRVRNTPPFQSSILKQIRLPPSILSGSKNKFDNSCQLSHFKKNKTKPPFFFVFVFGFVFIF